MHSQGVADLHPTHVFIYIMVNRLDARQAGSVTRMRSVQDNEEIRKTRDREWWLASGGRSMSST
jgi:hypothetical protein